MAIAHSAKKHTLPYLNMKNCAVRSVFVCMVTYIHINDKLCAKTMHMHEQKEVRQRAKPDVNALLQ